jgi:hypothetical protein
VAYKHICAIIVIVSKRCGEFACGTIAEPLALLGSDWCTDFGLDVSTVDAEQIFNISKLLVMWERRSYCSLCTFICPEYVSVHAVTDSRDRTDDETGICSVSKLPESIKVS